MGRLKPRGERKSRLSGRLSAAERDALCERWLVHVVGRLESEARVSRLILLAAGRRGRRGGMAAGRKEGLERGTQVRCVRGYLSVQFACCPGGLAVASSLKR